MDQPNNDPTKAWFDSIPDTSNPSPLPGEPQKQSFFNKKRLLIILSILAIVIIGIGAFLLLQNPTNTAQACLSTSDYTALTGSQTPDKQYSSDGIFYTTALSFTPKTAAYFQDTESTSKDSLKKIAAFYTSRYPKIPITLTISADYFENDTLEAANKRITVLHDFFVQNGVKSESIHANSPESIDSSGELENDSDELTHATAYVSIVSYDRCQKTK